MMPTSDRSDPNLDVTRLLIEALTKRGPQGSTTDGPLTSRVTTVEAQIVAIRESIEGISRTMEMVREQLNGLLWKVALVVGGVAVIVQWVLPSIGGR